MLPEFYPGRDKKGCAFGGMAVKYPPADSILSQGQYLQYRHCDWKNITLGIIDAFRKVTIFIC